MCWSKSAQLAFEFDVAWGLVLSGLLPTGIEVPCGLFYRRCSIPLLYEGFCWVLLNLLLAEIAGRDRILLSWALMVYCSGWSFLYLGLCLDGSCSDSSVRLRSRKGKLLSSMLMGDNIGFVCLFVAVGAGFV